MGVRIRALGGLVAVVGVPFLAVVALHRVGAPMRPPATVLPETAVVEAARLTALGLSYVVIATTCAHLAALLTGNRRLIRSTACLVLPAVRAVAARAVAGSLAVTVLAGPALAEPGPGAGTTTHGPTIDVTAPLVAGDYPPGPYRIPGEESRVDEAEVAPPAPPEDGTARDLPPDEQTEHDRPAAEAGEATVRSGDSLWTLAERRLTAHLGRPPGDPETAPYWRIVVDSNLDRLRSGNPDLIFPGERIHLPEPDPVIPAGS